MRQPAAQATVLVVEDDPDITDALKEILGGEGFAVVAAANGKEGLQRLVEMKGENEPCLVLLDLMMPVMNGVEFLQTLPSAVPRLRAPVFILSAWPQQAAQYLGQVKGFLKKPVSLDALLRVTHDHCRARTP